MPSREDQPSGHDPDNEKPENGESDKKPFNLLRFWLSKLMQHPFLKHVSIVAIGPLVSQTLSTVLSPIITRLYSPESYGALGVFLSVLSVLVPISSLSYQYAIILPKKDRDGLKILRFILLFAAMISLLVFALVLLFNKLLAELLNLQGFEADLYFLPLALFFSTAVIVFDQWMIRKKQFKASSGVVIAQSVLSNGSLIGLGYCAPEIASLIGVNTFARGFHALAASLFSLKTIRSNHPKEEKKDSRSTDSTNTRVLLRDYRDFPLYRTPQILISTLEYNLPFMLMTAFSGTADTGFYLLAHRVLKLPQIVISESVGKVFQQRIAETARQGRALQPLIFKTTLALGLSALIPLGTIIAFGPGLFSLIFGSEWYQAGIFARWISTWVLVTFSSVPVVAAIPVLNLQKQYLIFEIISLIMSGLGLVIGFTAFKSSILAVALYSCIGAALILGWMIFVLLHSRDRNRYHPS